MSAWGRRKAETKVFLNVYDLSPSNEYLHQFGLGLFHSGVEVHGVEWTFSGGSGVFSMTPKVIPGDQQTAFRESVFLGTTKLSSREVEAIARELRDDFPPESYNLVSKNCNCFAEEFTKRLLNRSIPGYVNRVAYLGSFLSCLLPPQMLGQAPVEGGAPAGRGGGSSGAGGGSVIRRHAPRGRAAAAPQQKRTTFSGTGLSLSGDSAAPARATSEAAGSGSGSSGAAPSSELDARRKMLAEAALLRQQRRMAAAEAKTAASNSSSSTSAVRRR